MKRWPTIPLPTTTTFFFSASRACKALMRAAVVEVRGRRKACADAANVKRRRLETSIVYSGCDRRMCNHSAPGSISRDDPNPMMGLSLVFYDVEPCGPSAPHKSGPEGFPSSPWGVCLCRKECLRQSEATQTRIVQSASRLSASSKNASRSTLASGI